jgi:tetratricopeptide (TPR) repeat protein
MSRKSRTKNKTAPFNEGEYLKDFDEIDDALEKNMRAEGKEMFNTAEEDPVPFGGIEDILLSGASGSTSSSSDHPEPDLEDIPFTSPKPERQAAGPGFQPQAGAESVIYRQAKRGKRTRRGKRGIWVWLPHIGHRKRHWIQRHFVLLFLVTLIAGAAIAYGAYRLYQFRAHPSLLTQMKYAEAMDAHARQNHKLAAVYYEEYLAQNPRDYRAMFFLASCYDALGQIPKAREYYEKVWADYPRYLSTLSTDLRQRNRFNLSTPDYYGNSLYELGRLAWTRGDYRQAGDYFLELTREFPNHIFIRQVEQALDELARTNYQPTSIMPPGAPIPEQEGETES